MRQVKKGKEGMDRGGARGAGVHIWGSISRWIIVFPYYVHGLTQDTPQNEYVCPVEKEHAIRYVARQKAESIAGRS